MNKIYIIFGILIVIAFIFGLFLSRINLTGNVVAEAENYTWTKAVCNSENWCMDVAITCQNGNVAKIEPVDSLIKNKENWTDIRGNLSSKLC